MSMRIDEYFKKYCPDEWEQRLSQCEKALSAVGIDIRNDKSEYKTEWDIHEEIVLNWDSMK
jgi:hypothetical protein